MESDNAGTKASTDAGHLDASTLLPAQGDAAPERVVGTLDLNIGQQLTYSAQSVALHAALSAMLNALLYDPKFRVQASL